jgi:glyoxylase-like metal-dependent hydrolase (beta-lactamase superfamily II)
VPEFDLHLRALGDALTLVQPGHVLGPGIRLLGTPGHTPGHVSVLIESRGALALCLGDVCHHPAHFGHPDWTSAFDRHPARTPATRRHVLGLAADRHALVLCPHALFPGFGHVRRTAQAFAWEPVQVQGGTEATVNALGGCAACDARSSHAGHDPRA